MQSLHGDHGLALVQRSLHVKYINEETSVVLIRIYRTEYIKVLQALAIVKNIGPQRAFFCTIHVGGTLRSCYKHLSRLVMIGSIFI